MPDALRGLFCFAVSSVIVIAIVTVVGHGLWVMFSAIFGRRTPEPPMRLNERERFRTCPGCGSEYFTRAGSCEDCGLDPLSDKAKELRDLAAATRALERLLATDNISRELHEQLHQSIEARQRELLPRKREPELTPLQQIEAWFGAELGKNMSVDDKKRALSLARNLQTSDLHDLSANGLVGVARLFTSVGMLSRACQIYDVLIHNYPKASITARCAREAFRIADNLNDAELAEEWTRILERVPDLLTNHPELTHIIAHQPPPIPEAMPLLVEPIAPATVYPVEPIVVAPVPRYAERRVQPPEPVVPIEPPAPRRSFAEWIGVFMEERNIMWGELIGGTLIVGCSIALVISLWARMQEVIPIFPFIILAAVTSAIFSAGLYTLHHWKLESTSRGLLVIGTLMVPLNFLVLAGLAKPGEAGWIEYLSESATLAVFSWLLYRSSHVLIQTPLNAAMASAAFTAAMLVSVTTQLFAPSLLEWGTPYQGFIALLPVLAFLAAMSWILLRISDWTLGSIVAMLFALASLTFACGVNLSFVVWAPPDVSLHDGLLNISPALTLLGIPILLAGTFLHLRLTHADRTQFGLWRTLGTSIALAGMFVMFAGFAVSVESLPHRWFNGALNIVTLLVLAWTLRAPLLHVPMQVYLAALVVFGEHTELDALIADPIAAPRLCGLLLLQTILAELLLRFDRRRDGQIYAVGAAVSTALAIATMLPFATTHTGTMALVLGFASLTWLTANVRWRMAEITYGCALVLGGSLFFASRYLFVEPELPFGQHLLWSALALASLCLAASISMRASVLEWLTNAFRIPLQFASLFATFGTAALLIVELAREQSWTITAIGCAWLALLWCVIAVLEGWPLLFGVFQAALGFTWFFGIGAWLHEMEWNRFEPYSLHIYALGFASLSLAWELTRFMLRAHSRAMALLSPAFVPMDRLTSGALVIVQFGLTMVLSIGAFDHELGFLSAQGRAILPGLHEHAFSIWAWLITLVLGGVVIAWLREFDLQLPALGLTLLLLTLPLLVAGTFFDADRASASAARWGLALVYGGVSLLLWNRHRLGEERAALVPVVAMRGLLIIGAVVPMLLITGFVAVARIGGNLLPGPVDESIFVQMGRPVSLLLPLAMLSAALAGHGFRERATRYLFAAGVLINLGCIGGFFLILKRNEIPFGQTWVAVDTLLLSASVSWVWSIAWSWITSVLEKNNERATDEPLLLKFNVALGVLPFAIALARAVVWIMFENDDQGRMWTHEVGTPWGWLTFALTMGGSCFLSWRRSSAVPMHMLGAWSLVGVGMIACAFEFVSPGDSFIALMFGSGVFACAWVWFTMLFDPAQPPRWLLMSHHHVESALYATLAAGLAIFLGSGVLLDMNRHAIWSANSVILGATAFALLAYQLKKDVWSTFATLGMMIASTIMVAHFADRHPHLELCIVLTGLAVLGASSLARLALHRLLHAEETHIGDLHQLPLQIFWGMVGVVVLAGGASFALIAEPERPDKFLNLLGDLKPRELAFLCAAGWLAFLTNLSAAAWYVGRTRPQLVVHAVALTSMCLGIALAVSADLIFESDWLAHHVATLSWTLLAMAILALSWFSHANESIGPEHWTDVRRTRFADYLRQCFPERSARFWITLCGAVVVMFALRVAMVEPARPYWSIGNTLAVSVLLGTLAVWTRSPLYTFASGLLINVIGLLVFFAWSAHPDQAGLRVLQGEWTSTFMLAQIVSFGIAAILWSLLERQLLRSEVDLSKELTLPFSQFAILAGVLILAVGATLANSVHLTGTSMPLAWCALGVLIAATLLEIWRSRFQRFTRFQLYTCGLIAIGTTLHGMNLANDEWFRHATLLLAGYVLAIVVLARFVLAIPALQNLLGFPVDDDEQTSIAIKPTRSLWFWHVQLVSIGVVVLLSLWITNWFDAWQSRLSGAIACLFVTIAAFLLVKVWHRITNDAADAASMLPRYLVMTLGLIVSLEIGWALLDVNLVAINMQRVALSFTTVVAAMFVCRFALPRLLRESSWFESSRLMGSFLGVVSLSLLLVLLGFEMREYNSVAKCTPLLIELAIPSTAALIALAGLAIYSALTKSADPFGIEEESRTWYVYLTELLVLLLLAHGRLNVPDLWHPIIGKYWYLVVSVLAFIGVAFAELFKRKNLAILAGPLHRSAIALAFVPVIAFRLLPMANVLDGLRGPIPGIEPFLAYLDRMNRDPQTQMMEPLCWLLLSIFLGTLARLHRSANLGIVAALAINCGVWVLLGHTDTATFFERPQLWLIPLGLIVLVAEFINRDRLGFFPSVSVRYVGLLLIYMSSTIEMLKDRLENPLYAIALAIVAVVGMLLGILFRVRAFLLAGFMALLIVIFAQIWNAAVVHSATWVWWASGIVLGVIILVMFALFEKHRNEVAKMLDNMKRWN